ncbi:hypothetical protein [Paracidovorax avenae]|uniref:hypothetical protein n=1 Tax=Paracidovorax avenae TaxID=80867 RepID=UPI00126018C7|nr:hypothetical protein [Paracidovorax avenae]
MRILLLVGLVVFSCWSWAEDLAIHQEEISILGREVKLPAGCEITDVKNRFVCKDDFENEYVIGFNEGDEFEKTIEKNYQEAVFNRSVLKTDYGYFIQYIAKKSGAQYSFIYLEKEKIVFFGGDLKSVYTLAMQTQSLLRAANPPQAPSSHR